MRCLDDFVITNKDGQQGLSLTDGTVVLNPIFGKITVKRMYSSAFFHAEGVLGGSYDILPTTYGEGLICITQYSDTEVTQYYSDKTGKPIITFDSEWYDRNKIPYTGGCLCPVKSGEKSYFSNGFLIISFEEKWDENCITYYKYKIDKHGKAVFLNKEEYGTPNDYTIQDYYNDNPDVFDGYIF